MDHPAAPPLLHEHAAENLRFIRDTMARATDFTAVPGVGGVLMGVVALAAAAVAGSLRDVRAWLGLWIAAAGVAGAIGLIAVLRKARRPDMPLHRAVARRFALAFMPALIVGAVLTAVFVEHHGGHVHGARRLRLLGAHHLGRFVHGGWLRRPSHRLRHRDREELRWVKPPGIRQLRTEIGAARSAIDQRPRRPLPTKGRSPSID
jgi:hypothetical protein